MASLEVGIGADNSEFLKKISETEKEIQKLSQLKLDRIKLGLDTKELDSQIANSKKGLKDLQGALKDTGQSFSNTAKPVANAGNALTQFGRIAQDAPFGIQGIGNNLTATFEAFGSLSTATGGAGNALKALGATLLGPGGLIFAGSLLVSGLTIMAQKGITVGDVFDKLTGNFDENKQALKEINKEVAKSTAEEIFNIKALVSAASDETLSRQKRLTAVKQLQDQYPAYFANLTKEQILNGNVGNSVKDVTEAIKAKAKAQALAGKLGELAVKEFEAREKEAALILKVNKYVKEHNKLMAESKVPAGQFDSAVANAAVPVKALKDRLAELQDELRNIFKDRDRIAALGTVEVKASLDLSFKPEKLKKAAKQLQDQVSAIGLKPTGGLTEGVFNIEEELNKQFSSVKFDPLASINERLAKSREQWKRQMQGMVDDTKSILFSWNDVMSAGFSDIGNSIGEALASGGNVLESIGASLLSSLGNLLSQLGDKLIVLGTTAVLAGTVLATMFTPVGIAAGIAAIAAGVALKAGGGLASGLSKNMSSGNKSGGVSAGNSVSSPTSSVSNGSSFNSGSQTVVFEISGQSLVGVLSNTLNRNTKLGGTIAI